MRKRSVMKLFSVLLTVAMAGAPIAVSASGPDEAGSIVDGSQLTLSDFVEDEELILARGAFLARGASSLTDLGDRVVGVGGETTGYVDCDTLICNLFLEQKDDEGYWNTYAYWDFSNSNNHILQVSTTKKVAGGHWYRVKGGHIAILNNAIESTATLTDGIWID